MTNNPDFDVDAAHRFFSGECFNNAWELMDNPDRTAEEDEMMIRLSLASHWHWTQREDYSETSASTAHWQTSRVYALLGQADNARKYGQLCLVSSQGDDVPAFYLAYAYEALARAESVAGNWEKMAEFLDEARHVAEEVADADFKKMLLDDLDTIE